jgi:6,7-dimethyl-8-ribityllumazine synthase
MSADSLNWQNPDAKGLRFAVVVARFNSDITEKLLAGACEALKEAGAEGNVIFRVPGAFELPLACKKAAETGAFDAVIALGAVIRGDTPHFDYVAGEAARGLQNAALETGVPLIFGVLTTDTHEQAAVRAGGSAGNKGRDAALTAVEMVRLLSSIETHRQVPGGRAGGAH